MTEHGAGETGETVTRRNFLVIRDYFRDPGGFGLGSGNGSSCERLHTGASDI